MRAFAAALVAVLSLSSCIPSTEDSRPKAATPSPTSTEATEPREKVPDLGSLLAPRKMRTCMFRKKIPADQATIRRLGLLAWLVGHVKSDRQINFDVPISDLRLLEGSEFSAEIDKRVPRTTSKDEDKLRLLAWALGLSPHGIDVNAFLDGGEATLIAGLYDQESGDVVIRSKSEDRATPRGIITLAHELTHAATDQRFGLKNIEKTEVIDDRLLAYRSFVEGDASLVEFRFISRFSPPKAIKKGLEFQLGFEERLEKGRRGGMPELMIDSVVFPYQWGFGFVCAIYKEHGWAGVNRMYEKHPPTTTAQIMFPKRYLAREEAIKPARLPKLERPWRSIAKGTLGAAHLKSLFEAPGNIGKSALSRPVGRAASWAGGTYELWEAKDERFGSLALGLVEHERYPGLLCASMRAWYEASFPEAEVDETSDSLLSYEEDNQSAVISCEGSDVRVGISPDGEIAAQLAR